jgi:hypothetical protein
MKRLQYFSALVAALVASLSAFVQAQGYTHFSHAGGANAVAFPKTLLVANPEIEVRELNAAGGLEKVPQWATQSVAGVRSAVDGVMTSRADFKVVSMPPLSEQEKDELEDFLAAYWVVGQNAHLMINFGGSAWAHRRTKFDYTLGEGLPWLADKTGADAIVVSLGDDIVSSGGRVAMTVLAAAAGVALPTGRSIITFAVIDLRTGDLSWMHYDQSAVRDLKNPASAKVMTEAVFKTLPAGGKTIAAK